MEYLMSFMIFGFIAGIYFLPGIIAVVRGVDVAGIICILNLVFGLTVIGWLACLLWACCGKVEEKNPSYRGKSRG